MIKPYNIKTSWGALAPLASTPLL